MPRQIVILRPVFNWLTLLVLIFLLRLVTSVGFLGGLTGHTAGRADGSAHLLIF